MSNDENKNKNEKVVNIQKFNPKEASVFSKEPMPFTQISNKVINECQNPVAGFIWIYLQSKPETWKPCKWEIMKRFDISESTYKRHMKYLKATNLVETCMIKNEDGKIDDWRIIVLNGSRFNPKGDEFKGTMYAVHINQSVKNDPLDNPSPDKDFNQEVKFDPVEKNQRVKKPPTGEMNPHINKDKNLNKEKINNPPISPQGGNKSISFSLTEMLEDNPFNIPESVLSDWLQVRKAKKAKLTATAWLQANTNLRKLKEAGLSPLDCFLKAVANGWAGVEFRYFDRDIDALKSKPRFPNAEERAANEQKIREREIKAQAEKQAEIEASKGFKSLMDEAKVRKTRHEIHQEQEAERLKMGLSVTEYHAYVLEKARQGTMQKDPV